MIVLDDQIHLFHSLECVAENANDRPPRPLARKGNGSLLSAPPDDQVHLFQRLGMIVLDYQVHLFKGSK